MNALSLKADKLSFCAKIKTKRFDSFLIATLAHLRVKRCNFQSE